MLTRDRNLQMRPIGESMHVVAPTMCSSSAHRHSSDRCHTVTWCVLGGGTREVYRSAPAVHSLQQMCTGLPCASARSAASVQPPKRSRCSRGLVAELNNGMETPSGMDVPFQNREEVLDGENPCDE